MSEERAWLVESHQKGGIWYLCHDGTGTFDWSDDPLKATRFSRRVDADGVGSIFEEHNVHINEHMWLDDVDSSDLAALEAQFREKAKAVADGLKRIESIVEHGLKREIESPSNHQEFAREAGEKLRQFRKDLKDAEAVLALHAEIEKRKGRE